MRLALWPAFVLLAGCSAPEEPVADNPQPPAPPAYTHQYAPSLNLDIHTPEGDGPFPTVILIHGGGWMGGSRGQLAEHSKRLNAKGLAAVSIDYRLAPQNVWPAQIDDCETAVKWIRENGAQYKLKTDKLVSAGESAGGHLSMWLAAKGDVQAVGSVSGLHDLTLPMTPAGEKYEIVQRTLGEDYPAGIKAFSPLLAYKAGMPPVFFIHGKKDPLVPIDHSTKAAERLKELGIAEKVILLPEMGHGFGFQTDDEKKAWDEFADWSLAQLK
ncbi:alpha/beta hydrolase [bacterium]|nr:MAG: alpha/beta hydrolase [bacterium]